MKKCSSLTFGDLIDNLNFVKVTWNSKVVYDEIDREETFKNLVEVTQFYKDKIVYEMNIEIVDFHHCILNIKGEE